MLNSFARSTLKITILVLLIATVVYSAGFTPEQIITASMAETGREDAGEIQEYFRYRFDQLKNDSGIIPDNALMDALKARQDMISAAGPGIRVAGIDHYNWTSIGPANVGGRIRAVLPISATTVFVGSVSGGIWKTTNCCSTSTTWTAIDDFMPNLSISSLIVDPTNSNVMYAGTGEGFGNFDAVRGLGVFKSTDGGATWPQLSSTNNPDWHYVNRLAISPNGTHLLAATSTGLYHSTDGGATWTLRVAGNWLDVKFDPTNSAKAVASGDGIARYTETVGSTNTWTLATGLPDSGRIELAYAPSDTTITYASVNNGCFLDPFNVRICGEVYKSTDGGHSYTRVNTGVGYLRDQGWYDNTIWVKPNDPNFVVVGGINMYKSTNGGTTLTQIAEWSKSWSVADPPSPHADHHALVSIPGSTTALLNGNDGGIYYTADISTAGNNPPNYNNGWVYMNDNLGITQFYGAAGRSATGTIFGGTQDNGVLSNTIDSGEYGWIRASGSGWDGGKSAADTSNWNYFYNEYIFGQVYRSSDGGATADKIWGLYNNGAAWVCRAAPYRIDDACNNVGNFIAPILLDPNDNDTLYVGGLSLWRTDDAKTPYVATSATGGPQWTAVKPAIGSAVNAIAVAPSDSNIIWVGYKNGRIDISTNGGANWTQIDGNIGVNKPTTQVSSISIDRIRSGVVYVSFTGFGPNRIWRTTDDGAHWTNISIGLPQAPIYAIAINPANSAWIYIGTEIGIFASMDRGATWNVPAGGLNGDGPANVATFDLQWMDGANSIGSTTLIAATHGRGVFIVDTSVAVPPGNFAKYSPANGITNVYTSLILSWNPSGDSSSYEYCYDSTLDGACSGAWNSTGSSTDVALNGISAGTTYEWQVRANGAGGTVYADDGAWWTFATVAPDLTVTKTNDVDGVLLLGGSWKWTIRLYNNGVGVATFYPGHVLLTDNMPNVDAYYSPVSVGGFGGTAGDISIAGSPPNLILTAVTAITMPPGSYWEVVYFVTPTAPRIFTNPRIGGVCMADPFGVVPESAEDNNSCYDSVQVSTSAKFISKAAQDGYVTEKSELADIGGSSSATSSSLLIGDASADRQIKGFLSFDTGSLPDDAVIKSTRIRLRLLGWTGTNPFRTHGSLRVDAAIPSFGALALAPADFQTIPIFANVAKCNSALSVNWFDCEFFNSNYTVINLLGFTQLRLNFSLDDNDDSSPDYLKIASGNHPTSAYRPVLIVDYFIP